MPETEQRQKSLVKTVRILQSQRTRGRLPDLKKSQKGNSVLRVSSKRIDNLLNLVSETVITKGSFQPDRGKVLTEAS